MSQHHNEKDVMFTVTVGLAAWCVPGAGYYLLKESKRGILVCVTVVLTFLIGLSVGSIGVIDKIGAKPWYVAQVMNWGIKPDFVPQKKQPIGLEHCNGSDHEQAGDQEQPELGM